MSKLAAVALSGLVLASGPVLGADLAKETLGIDEKTLKEIPEPIKCYTFLGEITGDEKMPVGLAVQLCAGTKNARETLLCYKMAFEAIKLNRGLSIELCGQGKRS
jgi:hypothetical protein